MLQERGGRQGSHHARGEPCSYVLLSILPCTTPFTWTARATAVTVTKVIRTTTTTTTAITTTITAAVFACVGLAQCVQAAAVALMLLSDPMVVMV